jgi:hypothetical protein
MSDHPVRAGDALGPHVTDPRRVRELLAAVPDPHRSVSGER